MNLCHVENKQIIISQSHILRRIRVKRQNYFRLELRKNPGTQHYRAILKKSVPALKVSRKR